MGIPPFPFSIYYFTIFFEQSKGGVGEKDNSPSHGYAMTAPSGRGPFGAVSLRDLFAPPQSRLRRDSVSQSDDGEGVLKIPAGEAQRNFPVLRGHGPQEPRFCGGEIFADQNSGGRSPEEFSCPVRPRTAERAELALCPFRLKKEIYEKETCTRVSWRNRSSRRGPG